RNVARKFDEEITYAGVSPRDDQVPPLEEYVNDEKALVNPPPLTNENIRATLFQIAQSITTEAQAVTTQAQTITTQANREVVPRAQQHVATMASHLMDFTRMNPPYFYGSKVVKERTGDFGSDQEGFLDLFFPREKRESKVVDLINLLQGCVEKDRTKTSLSPKPLTNRMFRWSRKGTSMGNRRLGLSLRSSLKMNTVRTPSRRVEDIDVHEEIPPQVKKFPQGDQGDLVPIGGQGNDVPVVPPELSNSDIG
ncbi:hypothetical protein EJD97_004444, partial [Solanum chilense]